MNLVKERKAIDTALSDYRDRLDTIPDELFQQTPADGSWSAAEVYSHILQATLGASIAAERCANNNGQSASGGLNFIGRLMLFIGRFPRRVKVSPATAAKIPAVKISKEDAKNLIIKCRKRIDDTASLVKDSSSASRYRHPRLGMLNAQQWFKFIR